jgi:hypothetical protein
MPLRLRSVATQSVPSNRNVKWMRDAHRPSRRISARMPRPTVMSRPGRKVYTVDPTHTANREANASVGMATPFRRPTR